MKQRFLFALLCWLVATLLVGLLLPRDATAWAMLGIFSLIVGLTFPLFFLVVPEVTGYVTLDLLTGGYRGYGSGLRMKFPWERITEKKVSLEIVTVKFEETFAAEDGPMMHVKGSYQYNADENRLPAFIRVDETTIANGFTDVISSILSEVIGGMQSETARQDIKRVEREMLDRLNDPTIVALRDGGTTSMKEKLEAQYGINFRLLALADIDFSPAYQAAREGVLRMERLADATQVLKGKRPGLSDAEVTNAVLLEQGKGTEKRIIGLEGIGPLAEALGRLSRKRS